MDGTATPFDQKKAIDTIRVLSIDAIQQANSGHPGAPMGAAPMTYALWTSFLKHAPTRPDWMDRDRFVLSAGHASMLLYSMLHLTGYDLPLEEIKRFRQMGSKTPGHPEYGMTAGVESTTGPLGQGFSNAVGMAMAEQRLAQEFNQPGHEIIDHRTYTLCGDGDLQEGITAEAASLAGHLKLGKLTALWDDNDIQLDGPTSLACSEDVLARFDAYGWHTQRVEDGEDVEAIKGALEAAQADDRPSIISVKTIIGAGAPNKAGTHKVHGSPLGADEVAATKAALGFDPEASFDIAPEVLSQFRQAADDGEDLVTAWEQRLTAYTEAFPEAGAELRRRIEGSLAEGWDAELPTYETDPKGIATRNASKNAIAGLEGGVPELIGGSADVSGSNLTDIPEEALFSAEEAGRNIRYGVREHAMGGIANGLAYHGGLVPFVATFLPFSDYMRGSVRVAALSGIQVIYVWTHDSIGVGEDGPTHQSVEHYAALRAIPNLTFIRAGDPNEASAGWALAVENKSGPTAMTFTRQPLPVLPGTAELARDGVRAGGYVLAEAVTADGTVTAPELILMATGSELHLAMGAREALTAEGLKVRVVSMPSWERFEAQPAAYRDEVLPPEVTARVSIESGVSLGWDRYVNQRDGAIMAIDRYGMSAPAPQIFEAFGLTAENVTRVARGVLTGDVRGIISPDADHAGTSLAAAEAR